MSKQLKIGTRTLKRWMALDPRRVTLEKAQGQSERAVGMVNGGLTQGQVTKHLEIGTRTLKRWMTLDRRGETLENVQGQREEDDHETTKIHCGGVCTETAPVNKEADSKKKTVKHIPSSS